MTYTMHDALEVAKLATADIEAWLRSQLETIDIVNVEDDPQFQCRDIDLIWKTHNGETLIEIKGDRWNKTRNLFFETHSNLEKGTPGCFLYTEADWLFYYFVNTRQLYKLPMPKTREWFLITMRRFQERSTKTPVGSNYYTTVGRLVPIAVVMLEVPGVKIEQL
ncbi:hypothetical protein NIES37_15150 [Tolypothrix tenuis PCC 7101]|uniref:Uncharacterized protein n=1 Tax=Tolypothrix tenuis PCC 7101 TaxID=231146 RepID=A0A1Z4MVV5_9CYAN|nr:hypothetical protein NIES37_15150 [Tolypothrix tenuis PCC 7101]BAZ71919.1 hypothetical protein NIES50_04680 [Aulosira laxa NIES-50]